MRVLAAVIVIVGRASHAAHAARVLLLLVAMSLQTNATRETSRLVGELVFLGAQSLALHQALAFAEVRAGDEPPIDLWILEGGN